MLNVNMTTILANAFSKYVQHNDPRAHALALKADECELEDRELDELVARLEKLYDRFMHERAAILRRE